jgi:hypothetical protein
VGVLASLANIALLVLVAPLFGRFVPWVYGARAASPHVASTSGEGATLDMAARAPR